MKIFLELEIQHNNYNDHNDNNYHDSWYDNNYNHNYYNHYQATGIACELRNCMRF